MSNRKKSTPVAPPMTLPEDSRRVAVLDAAFGVFARFGYRKTSMDEVARAAGISRQGLYLHFANKEDLFRATLHYSLDTSSAETQAALTAKGVPLNERLCAAFDAWIGRNVGRFGADASDLMEAAHGLVGELLAERRKEMIDSIAVELREAGLAAAYKSAGVTVRQLAENLCVTAVGLKHHCDTPEEFREAFAIAVRITCAPLTR